MVSIKSKLILPLVVTVVKQRSVLGDNIYGPANRPSSALNRTRFPSLNRAPYTQHDMNTRRQVLSLYHGLMTY